MPTLTPSEAAAIAKGVYGLRDNTVSGLAGLGQALGCEGLFTATDNSRFAARSGNFAFEKISGFGYVAHGTGSYGGEMLLATRGTAMSVDWLSNLNIGMQLGPGSLPVHAGFNDVYKSFAPALRASLRNRNPARIHCVGHSLGGALATLNADMITDANIAAVSLYTFGAPRAGGNLFANSLSRRVGGSIHRVSHAADPVPMIPLFPFAHVPFRNEGMRIGNSGMVAVNHHLMTPSYIPGCAGQSWGSLTAASAAATNVDVQGWLQAAAEGHGSFLMGSASLLTMIGKALRWILAKIGTIVVASIGTVLAVGATALDQLAWLLGTGGRVSIEVAGYVRTLMRAIFRFLGRAIGATVDLTTAFIRWTLDLLFTALANAATRAFTLVS